ncbi:MAG: hypothetical protein IK083_05875 [Abditibacteriota bacterium]|nr:hypothetical protein [Abditibacteriota bacterium]
MKRIILLLIALISLACAAAAGEINVADFGAVGDGKTDNTEAFQKALDAAAEARFATVKVDNGNYLFKGQIRVPNGVTLEGTYKSVPANIGVRNPGWPRPDGGGSCLMPTADKNNEKGEPFLTINTNSTVRGFVFFYPDQTNKNAPFAYPWCVAMRGKNPALLDCELLNPFNGIDCSQNERHLVRNISGQPLRRGIFTDEIYDIGRWENIHWNPWFSMNEPLYTWQQEHGEGFILAKSDWQYVVDTFALGYKAGYHFIDNGHGACNGQFLGIGADCCNKSVLVDAVSNLGILITNGEFVAMIGEDPVMLEINKSNGEGTVMLSNCSFWGPCKHNVLTRSGDVTLQNCNFVNWDREKWDETDTGAASVEALGGNVIVDACRFQSDGTPVHVGGTCEALVFTGNIVKGSKRIKSDITTEIREQNNVWGLKAKKDKK